MGVLQVLLSWVSRVVILLSLLLFVVAGIAKEGSIPLSRASLRVAHLTSLRYVYSIETAYTLNRQTVVQHYARQFTTGLASRQQSPSPLQETCRICDGRGHCLPLANSGYCYALDEPTLCLPRSL